MVYRIRRTSPGDASNETTSPQARRQLWAIAGNFQPDSLTSNAAKAASPVAASNAADVLERGRHGLAVLDGDEVETVAQEVDDAG